MNKYISAIKNRLTGAKNRIATSSTQELAIGIGVVVGLIVLVVVITVFVQNSGTKIVYQPVVACELFSKDEAKELLGEQVIGGDPVNPTLTGDVATSKCSYTDVNPDKTQMRIAAVAIRSGINDEGVQQNKAEFALAKTSKEVEAVEGVGEAAYFNPTRGQLNVYERGTWFIFSNGIGEAPEANTLEETKELAQRVLYTGELPTF